MDHISTLTRIQFLWTISEFRIRKHTVKYNNIPISVIILDCCLFYLKLYIFSILSIIISIIDNYRYNYLFYFMSDFVLWFQLSYFSLVNKHNIIFNDEQWTC